MLTYAIAFHRYIFFFACTHSRENLSQLYIERIYTFYFILQSSSCFQLDLKEIPFEFLDSLAPEIHLLKTEKQLIVFPIVQLFGTRIRSLAFSLLSVKMLKSFASKVPLNIANNYYLSSNVEVSFSVAQLYQCIARQPLDIQLV